MKNWLALLVLFFSINSTAQNTTYTPRHLIHLLDYLAQDYGVAVKDGKVLDQAEYDEQVEFSENAYKISQSLSETKQHPQISNSIYELKKLVLKKAPPKEVFQTARKIQQMVLGISKLKTFPNLWPNIKSGEKLFSQNCTQCHGMTGRGDGNLSINLNPKPSNFWDETRMNTMSAFQSFNTIRIGVPGTAMQPFSQLSDQEIWDLTFYILSLRYEKPYHSSLPQEQTTRETLAQLSSGSDEELLKTYSKDFLIQLRTFLPKQDAQNFFAIARTYLQDAQDNYQRGNKAQAQKQALLAYLEGVELVEARLKSIDRPFTEKLEEKMSQVRASIQQDKDVQNSITQAMEFLNTGENLLTEKKISTHFTFLMASGIILREGFEAILIIIALLSIIHSIASDLRPNLSLAHRALSLAPPARIPAVQAPANPLTTNLKKATHWIHGGWIAALGCGGLAWIFSGWLLNLTGAQREILEGITSFLAVSVLLYLGLWLHSKTEIKRWTAFIQEKAKSSLNGKSLYGIGFLSFIAVFREVFETVLFLRALGLEGGSAEKFALGFGVASALILVFFLAWVLLYYSAKLPISKLFNISSLVMVLLAVVLTGKGFHALQEGGALSETALPILLKSDFLGIYPTLETFLSQLIILSFSIFLWFYGNNSHTAKISS